MWLLGLIYFIVLAAAFGLTFFVPDLVQDRTGWTDFEVGVLSAVPYGFATVAMVIMARRGGSLVAPALVGAVGTVITASMPSRRSCSPWALPWRPWVFCRHSRSSGRCPRPSSAAPRRLLGSR